MKSTVNMKSTAQYLTGRLGRMAATVGLAVVAAACGTAASPTIVADGKARDVIVTPVHPGEPTSRAAQELVDHIERATGATLPIAPEDAIPDAPAYRIYVGDTRVALKRGLKPDALRQGEAFAIRSIDDGLIIAGKADFGVYELLDRFVGVRWLWPGELGTHVPKTDTLTIPADLDQTIEPAFVRRLFRPSGIDEEDRPAFETFGSRHRTGGEYLHGRGHYFGGWWDRYGKQHPEWFRENAEGKRVGPTMCVSNPELHDFIIEKQAGRIKNRGHLRLGEADHWNLCQCEVCKSWDKPQPESIPGFARRAHVPQTASNRYARFWKIMHEKASKLNPDVKVVAFIYHRYTTAPTIDIELNENIVLEYVQWADPWIQYFPVTDKAYEWLKDQWLGWRETGATLTYRPNMWLRGYAMPYVNMHQTGEYYQFLHKHGNEGIDLAPVVGNWATRGPGMYMMYRLQARPEKPIDAILDEYYLGFGPAGDAVEEYFTYWEQHMIDKVDNARDAWLRFRGKSEEDPSFANFGDFYRMDRYRIKAAHWLFPLDSYDPARTILEKAAEQAARADNPVYARRVEFLRLGLEHAEMCTRLSATFGGAPTYAGKAELETGTEAYEKARKIYRRIQDFRERHRDKHLLGDELMERYEQRQWNVEELGKSE